MRRHELHAARALATTELRCRVRGIRKQPRKLLSTVLLVVLFGVLAPLGLIGPAMAVGQELGAGDPPIGRLGVAVAGVAGGGLYLGGATAMSQSELGRVGPLVRTATAPRAVVVGRAGSELLQVGVFVVPFCGVGLAAISVGARGLLAPILVGVGLLPVLFASLVGGRALGSTGRLVGHRLGVGGWTRVTLGLVAVAALYVGSQVAVRGAVEGSGSGYPETAVVPGAPLQAYARLVVAPLGGSVTVTGTAVAVGIAAIAVLSVAVATSAEHALLVVEEDGTAAGSGTVPWPFDRTPAARIGWRYLLRARRNPAILSHLFPVAFGLFSLLASFATDPGLLVSLGPGTVYVVAVLLAGATFGLNPLGDEREQLPVLLTSARSTAVLLRGRIVAGTTVGAGLVLAVGFPLDVYAVGGELAIAHAAHALVLAGCGAGTALWFGAAVPAFERREYMNVERAHPSMFVLFGYSLGGLVPAIGGHFLVDLTVNSDETTLLAGVWAVYLLVIVGIGVGGYSYAVRRFDGFSLDEV
ncbi:hypothetical protein [Haloarcula halophila]|uniref:hypothetical protein n=1 Tax=Haloarcula TaxID=2237 RepID=UPI0023E3B414|nr:hypothetical protein [Halomicroarcula sp. DFY41]